MIKIPLLLGFFVLCVAVVSAEDVVLTTNSVNYIIKNISSEYYVDGEYFFLDDTRFLFTTQGGSFDVTFYGNSQIGLQSNVPQTVGFEIKQGKEKLALYDDSYYIDSYNIGMESVNLTYKKAGSISVPDKTDNEDKFFLFHKVFEFEYRTFEKNDIIQGENFTITYLGLMIFVVILLGFIVGLVRWV